MTADADLVGRRLDRAEAPLPDRLLELAAVATELAEALRSPRLSAAQRARILRRATALAGRPRRRRPRTSTLVAAGAGGGFALVALAVAGIALARRGHEREPMATLRPAA